MPDVYELASKFQRELEDRQSGPVDQLMAGYGRLWQSLERDVERLTTLIADANEQGLPSIIPPVNGGLSARQLGGYSAALEEQRARLVSIQNQILRGVNEIGSSASIAVQDEQRRLIRLGSEHAGNLIREAVDAATPDLGFLFTAPSMAPLEALVGFAADGTPLNQLFSRLGPDAAASLTAALTEGIGLGRHPSVVAKQMQLSLGGNAARARTIARTELLRAYREANHAAFEANADVVRGWRWLSARKVSTCAMCWAMHGTEHEFSTRLHSHPNCRCAMVPMTFDYDALGIDAKSPRQADPGTGVELFEELSDSKQLAILGPGKYAAYKRGDIDLPDLVDFYEHPEWGAGRRETPLFRALKKQNDPGPPQRLRATPGGGSPQPSISPAAPRPSARPPAAPPAPVAAAQRNVPAGKLARPRNAEQQARFGRSDVTADTAALFDPAGVKWTDKRATELREQIKKAPGGKELVNATIDFQNGRTDELRAAIAKRLAGQPQKAGLNKRADAVLDAIDKFPQDRIPPTLYRGLKINGKPQDILDSLGDVMPMNVSGFSSNEKVSRGFAKGAKGQTAVMLEWDQSYATPGTTYQTRKAFPIERTSENAGYAKEQEWLAGGRFAIVGKELRGNVVYVKLAQIASVGETD